jgi:hypothetical protein
MTYADSDNIIWDLGYAFVFFIATFAAVTPPAKAQTCDPSTTLCGVTLYTPGDTANPMYNFPMAEMQWTCDPTVATCGPTAPPPNPSSATDAQLQTISSQLAADQIFLNSLIGKCIP